MAWKSGKPYTQDLRDRVFMAADEAIPVGQIAERLSVSISYVSKVLSRRRRDCPENGGIMINTIRPVGYVAGWGFADGMDAAIGWNGGHADPVRPSTAGRFRAAICYPKMAKNEPRRPEPTATTSAPPTAVLWDKLHASLEGDYD
jgi:hypothetical protein